MKQDETKKTLGSRSFPTFFFSSSTHFRFVQELFWFYVCFSKQLIQNFSLISTWILLLVDFFRTTNVKQTNKLIKKHIRTAAFSEDQCNSSTLKGKGIASYVFILCCKKTRKHIGMRAQRTLLYLLK